jgi:murein DD-endopeptidase MepM/ murein hydrolase activator NlpD
MSDETGGWRRDFLPNGNSLSEQEAREKPSSQPEVESQPWFKTFPASIDNAPQGMVTDFVETQEEEETYPSQWMRFWEWVSRAGLGEVIFRLGTNTLLIVLVLIVAWGLREFYRHNEALTFPVQSSLAGEPAKAAAAPNDNPTHIPAKLPELILDQPVQSSGLQRTTILHTELPSSPRMDVTIYTVQVGDTLFGIAEKFGLKPETLLWGNQIVLGDNPHNIRPGQELNILPIDGTYHRWSEGDGLNGVAKFFGVTPEDIINFPGNHLDAETIGDWSRPNIDPGTWLIIPGGKRSFVSWSLPPGGIPRENPSVAKGFGAGVCGSQVQGVVGAGAFIWPAPNHRITGFNWSPETNHSGVDIDGDLGQPVYAADNGVIVYAGWNNWGYGNVVVINHGNGWQTLYAHLDTVAVGCGQSVFQGGVIGTIGSTGNSTGPHLHFEMMIDGVKVNPNDYLP